MSASHPLAGQCTNEIDRLRASYRWELLDNRTWLERALLLLDSGLCAGPREAALGAYVEILYDACAGRQGSERQNAAYRELEHYVLGTLYTRFASVADDARADIAQSTLERVHRSLAKCRNPIAFLVFVGQHILDAVRSDRRASRAAPASLDSQAVSRMHEVHALRDVQQSPGERVLAQERSHALQRFFDHILAAHPRMARRIAVARLSFIYELDDAQIAYIFGTSVESIYAARSRLLKVVRDEPAWRQRALELGLLPDEV